MFWSDAQFRAGKHGNNYKIKLFTDELTSYFEIIFWSMHMLVNMYIKGGMS